MAVKVYKAQRRYRSGLGNFAEGDKVLLEPEEAEWFNRDSPGVLVPMPESSSSNPPEQVEGRALDGPPHDRMFRREDVEVRAEVPEATPAAVKLAEEHGIDLLEVEGTGADGKIVVGDIKQLVE